MNIALRIYTRLVQYYPAEFRSQFGEEIVEVFAQAEQEAARQGKRAILTLYLREARGLLLNQINLRFLSPGSKKEGLKVNTPMESNSNETGPASQAGHLPQPSTWGQSLAGAALFLLFPLSLTIPYWVHSLFTPADPAEIENPINTITRLLALGFLLSMLVLGAAKGFPRWSVPALGFGSLLVTAILFNFDDSLWNLFYFLHPIIPLAFLGLAWAGSKWKPLHPLYQDVRADWTLVSLACLCSLPLSYAFTLEESPYEHGVEIMAGLLSALGALAYLRSSGFWQRIITLPLTVLVICVFTLVYTAEMTRTGSPWSTSGTYNAVLVQGIVFLVLIGLPSVLELLRRREDYKRSMRSA